MYDTHNPEEPEDEGPSKSQLKREDEALQAVGQRLVELSKAKISRLPVNELLREALLEYKCISSREAQRRHLKRVAKLLRDHELEAVQLALERASPDSSMSMASTRDAERWCDRLLDEGGAALTEFVSLHPAVEVQRLRQLQRKAAKARAGDADQGPTPAQRELLRYVREQVLAVAR